MANATARVPKRTIRTIDEFIKRSVETLAAETRFYTNAMIGVDATGYFCKADDTQSWVFAGVVRGKEGDPVLPAGTAGDGTIDLDVQQPRFFELAVSGVTVADIGKKVYALYDQTGTLDASATTYANLVGTVAWVEVIDGAAVSGACWVKPAYNGVCDHGAMGAARFLPATGAVTLTKMDLNKTIVVTNTGAQTINLPAVAGTQAGDFLRFIKKSADAAAATLDGADSEEIDSSTTLATIDAEHDCAMLISDGTQWHVFSRDIA